MQFAHKQTGVKGGTQIVTVTEHNGKGLAKNSVIPTGYAQELNVPFKWVVKLVEERHIQELTEAVAKCPTK